MKVRNGPRLALEVERPRFDKGRDRELWQRRFRTPLSYQGFFDLFAVDESSTPGRDLGLGPALARRILALFGASVTVANREPPGIRLIISFRHTLPDW